MEMASLIPWKRKRDNSVPKNDMVNPFERFFDEPFLPSFSPFNRSEWWPRVDVNEGKSSITVEAEIPGMDKKDIDLSIEGGRWLHIRGRKFKENKKDRKGYYRVERSYGHFNRRIELPAEVDEGEIDAKYRRGVLKIKLKKHRDTGTKPIRISSDN